jgi:hypothetical protein
MFLKKEILIPIATDRQTDRQSDDGIANLTQQNLNSQFVQTHTHTHTRMIHSEA